jgi:hypothetical protein
MMKYKVQGNVLPTHIMPEGEHPVKATVISQWVDGDYNIGNYPLDYVKVAIDYRVGLREYEK